MLNSRDTGRVGTASVWELQPRMETAQYSKQVNNSISRGTAVFKNFLFHPQKLSFIIPQFILVVLDQSF